MDKHRCDRCPARYKERWIVPVGDTFLDLQLCQHHSNKHRAAYEATVYTNVLATA